MLITNPVAIAPSRRRHAYGMVKLVYVDGDTLQFAGMPGGSDLVFGSGDARYSVAIASDFSLSKNIDAAWTGASSAGGRLDGSIATINESLHCFIGYNPATEQLTGGMVRDNASYFDADELQPLNVVAGASGFLWLYVGSLRCNSGGVLYPFTQEGDRVFFTPVLLAASSTNYTTSSANNQSCPVPKGLSTEVAVLLQCYIGSGSSGVSLQMKSHPAASAFTVLVTGLNGERNYGVFSPILSPQGELGLYAGSANTGMTLTVLSYRMVV